MEAIANFLFHVYRIKGKTKVTYPTFRARLELKNIDREKTTSSSKA
jgi:hypothetical protein